MDVVSSSDGKWEEIPVLVLGQIYELLQPNDRLNASATCKRWRNVLFQKRFFSHLKFNLHIGNEGQCKFFRNTLFNLITELNINFDFLNVFHIDKICRILYKLSSCGNLQGLHFETNSVGLVPPGGIHNDGPFDVEHFIVEPLKQFLHRKKTPCKVLDLGAIEALTYYALDFLKSLGRPEQLEVLTLASIKYNPSHYPMFALENTLLQKFTALQVLSLDYDTLNEKLLDAMLVLPLKKLLICVHGLDRHHAGISERAWSVFAANFTNIELVLSLVYAFEAVEVLQVRILRQNMPITRLRVLFCDFMNTDALEWMSVNNNRTLKSIQWIDSACKYSNANIMDLFLHSGQDPFVMMSWRCKNLEEIVVHGYVMDPHNIVGISRLRGRTLKRLEVSMLDNIPDENSMEYFMEEIGILLGQKWRPMDLNQMHPALGYMPVGDDVRDDYVFDLLRSDISN